MRKKIIFPIASAALLAGCASSSLNATAEHQAIAQSADLTPVWAQVPSAMEESGLAGLSVVVFDDYRIIEQRSFGVRSNNALPQIDNQTIFSTASISKPVTAMLCMILEAEGAIDLDAPIAGYLQSWQLPQSAEFPAASEVTWRQLLSHTAGTTQHGFADFYAGDDIPSLIDSLEGRIPRYDEPIAFGFSPGTNWTYSGGGYVIVQLALEDHLGRSLTELAQEKIFDPLGMERTTMIQPGNDGFPGNAALVHDAGGAVIRDGLPITPQISASGMWSTPHDLALFAMAIQRALEGEVSGPVTPEIALSLTDVFALDYVGGMATPFFRGFGFGNTDWFRHDGSNTGVNADMLASMQGGYGIVMMGNGDDPNTVPVFAMLRREIISEMGWSDDTRFAEQQVEESLEAAITGTHPGLLYNLGLNYEIAREGDELWISSAFFTQFLGRERSRMMYLGDNAFRIEDYPNRLRFNLDAAGTLESVTIDRPGFSAPAVSRSASR